MNSRFSDGPFHSDPFTFTEDLARCEVVDLKRLGFSTRKSENILAVAKQLADGQFDFEGMSGLYDASIVKLLLQLPGVGRWTAEYVALRGYGRLDVFPGDDVGGQDKIQHWLKLPSRPGYERVHEILAPWEPYRGLLYFYLLSHHQAARGLR